MSHKKRHNVQTELINLLKWHLDLVFKFWNVSLEMSLGLNIKKHCFSSKFMSKTNTSFNDSFLRKCANLTKNII